jgi:hypothetical protein
VTSLYLDYEIGLVIIITFFFITFFFVFDFLFLWIDVIRLFDNFLYPVLDKTTFLDFVYRHRL